MSIHNLQWNKLGRRLTALMLLCGLLMPMLLQHSNAATVTYNYTWIKNKNELPADREWHDFFIAWEDTDIDNKYWFANYHWFTADGYDNFDAGGSHWMEYRSLSTLPDSTSTTFTSKESLGHMQIKFAGYDSDNGNAPMYYIRVSKMHGGYAYFTRYEPTNDEEDADAFTFLDQGDEFHIFVNLTGKADRYLTRDGQDLETTESSSYGGGDYWRPLRVYKRTFTIDETQDNLTVDVIGKMTLYEYSWVNTVEELMALTTTKDWTNILLAWEDKNEDKNNDPGKVWYSKEVWYNSENKPNYNNDGANEWWYYANDYLGSDGYGSPYAERFLLPYQVGHFQIMFRGWDGDNPIKGYTNAEGKTQKSPKFHFRFDIGHGQHIYIGNNAMYDNQKNAQDYTVQLRLGKETEGDILDGDLAGFVWIFNNIGSDQDEYFCREDNFFGIGNWNHSDYWEFPFRIYTYRPVEYDAIVKSFSIGKGATYSVDDQLIIAQDVTVTVEDGGVLTIDSNLMNNGKIVVKNGGTVVVNEGAYLMAYAYNAIGSIELDGGNLIIMEGAKVICDQGGGTLQADNGTTILNRGLLLVGDKLIMNHNSCLINEPNAMLIFGGKVTSERGRIDTLSYDEILSRVTRNAYTRMLTNNSKIVNDGRIDTNIMKPGTGLDTGGIDLGLGNGSGRFN